MIINLKALSLTSLLLSTKVYETTIKLKIPSIFMVIGNTLNFSRLLNLLFIFIYSFRSSPIKSKIFRLNPILIVSSVRPVNKLVPLIKFVLWLRHRHWTSELDLLAVLFLIVQASWIKILKAVIHLRMRASKRSIMIQSLVKTSCLPLLKIRCKLIKILWNSPRFKRKTPALWLKILAFLFELKKK